MELKQLEYFLKVAHYESFTRAAEDLYVTQPAISHSVRMLEEELGHELFTRKNQKILLNEKGKCFLPYAQQVFTALGNGKKALDALFCQGLPPPPAGSVSGGPGAGAGTRRRDLK